MLVASEGKKQKEKQKKKDEKKRGAWLTGEGNEHDGCALEWRRFGVEDDPDLASAVLAERGVQVGEGGVGPDQNTVLHGEGGGDAADVRVGPEGLIGDVRVGGDELAAAGERSVGEGEGRSQGAVGRVDWSSGADEAVAELELALADDGVVVRDGGNVEDVGVVRRGRGRDAAAGSARGSLRGRSRARGRRSTPRRRRG